MSEFFEKVSYDEFFETVWDYVSDKVVSDDMWERHLDRFQELTFDLYKYYKHTHYSENVNVFKTYARMIEAFVSSFKGIIR